MKILILSNSNDPHTYRWATALAARNINIVLFSLSKNMEEGYDYYDNIKIVDFGFYNSLNHKVGSLLKLKYILLLPFLKKAIRRFEPDIIHAHYASSYGILASLVNFHPFVISVWGSDIYEFPRKSIFHKKLLKCSIDKADRLLSTSNIMAKEIYNYTSKPIDIIPFGVDLNVFKPEKVKSIFNKNDYVIGTIKSLKKKYGIEYLIRAFKLVKTNHPKLPFKLLIVGGGYL